MSQTGKTKDERLISKGRPWDNDDPNQGTDKVGPDTRGPGWVTNDFKNQVVAQINADFTKSVQTEFDTALIDGKQFRLQDILGDVKEGHFKDGYWWRLYIDPKDWKAAKAFAEKENKVPGALYDNEKCSGYQTTMVGAYNTKFCGQLNPLFSVRTLGLEQMDASKYARMYDSVKGTGKNFAMRSEQCCTFPTTENLAEDVFEERIGPFPLVIKDINTHVAQMKPGTEIRFIAGIDRPKQIITAPLALRTLVNAIQSIFTTFYMDIEGARYKKEQLTSIARTIRSLHIMHAYGDGNGRLNIFTLLPAMLLGHGFGLPLGGAALGIIRSDALYMLFNGGFSIEEMTRYLWVSQDFGLMPQFKNVPSCLHEKSSPVPIKSGDGSAAAASGASPAAASTSDKGLSASPAVPQKPSSLTLVADGSINHFDRSRRKLTTISTKAR